MKVLDRIMHHIRLPRRFLAAGGIVIALLGIQMLGGPFSGLRPLNHHPRIRRSWLVSSMIPEC